MTCAACATKIERALEALPGAQHAEVNFATRRARIEWEAPNAEVSHGAQAVEAIRSLGYTASVGDPHRTHGQHDHGDDEEHEHQELVFRMIVALIGFVPLMVLSMGPWHFEQVRWISLLLATPVVLWAGLPIHQKAAADVRHRSLGMDTLISLGALVSFGWSVWITLTTTERHAMRMSLTEAGVEDVYFESAAGIIAFVLIGRVLEARARGKASKALRLLADLSVRDVELETGERIPLEHLGVGDRFVALPGERIATDGTVAGGNSAVDASLVTGEPVPVDVEPGSAVVGGTLNVTGRIVIEAKAVGNTTMLARISEMVAAAQNGKPQLARLADRISRVFVPVVIVLSVLVGLGWWLATGDIGKAVSVAVAVIVIACPCALGLATPIAVMVGTGRAAREGILFRDAQTLERAERIDTFLFDKTGTLTTGVMAVEGLLVAEGFDERTLLQYAASVEAGSQHPIAEAIVRHAHGRLVRVLTPDSSAATHGSGMEATLEGKVVRVGRRNFVGGGPSEVAGDSSAAATGATIVYCSVDGVLAGAIVLRDAIRAEAGETVRAVHALGARTMMVTGDGLAPAQHVANALGIEQVHAEAYPADKLAFVSAVQAAGGRIAVIGDGVNDAPALAAADLGIAIGTGADIAIESADVSLIRADIAGVPHAVGIARATMRTIRQNLAWAFGYNALAIPIAASGRLNAFIAAAAMAASDVCVVLNALRLWRWKPSR